MSEPTRTPNADLDPEVRKQLNKMVARQRLIDNALRMHNRAAPSNANLGRAIEYLVEEMGENRRLMLDLVAYVTGTTFETVCAHGGVFRGETCEKCGQYVK